MSYKGVSKADGCFSVSTLIWLYNHKDGLKINLVPNQLTKFKNTTTHTHSHTCTHQVTKLKWTRLLQSSSFSSSLSVFPPMQLWFLLTSQWDLSCWSPLPKPVMPPREGRTATAHSNCSNQEDQEVQEHQLYQQPHEVPSLHHDHLCHKLVDQDCLQTEWQKIRS